MAGFVGHPVGPVIVNCMQNTGDTVFQRQRQNHILKTFSVEFRLCGSHDVDQQFIIPLTSADNQIPHQAVVLLFVIIPVLPLAAEIQHRSDDHIEILVHQLTFIHVQNRHILTPLVHAQSHLAALFQISEGIFHLVAVAVNRRTSFDAHIPPGLHFLFFDIFLYFLAFQKYLLFISDALIKAAAALSVQTANFHKKPLLHFIHNFTGTEKNCRRSASELRISNSESGSSRRPCSNLLFP